MSILHCPNHCGARLRKLTNHAAIRMQQRGISPAAIEATLAYGRRIHAKGATFCVVGHKEVQRYAPLGVDLSPMAGVQVLLGTDDVVITVYRSHDLHSIKATRRPRGRSAK